MKTILKLAAVAVLVAGTLACKEEPKVADPATTTEPAVSATETSSTDVMTTTDPVPAPSATDTSVTTTETTATTVTTTDATSTQ